MMFFFFSHIQSETLLFQFMPIIFCSSALDHLEPSVLQVTEAQHPFLENLLQPLDCSECPLILFQLISISLVLEGRCGISDAV